MKYDKEYIQSKIRVDPITSCWNWQFCCDRLGYGQVSRRSSGESLAHRLAYRIYKGPIIGVLRHTCDNPPCCNPDHLVDGSQADNLEDARQKGRMLPKQPWKVTKAKAAGIKKYLLAGVKQRTIADIYKISESHLSTIKHSILKDPTP